MSGVWIALHPFHVSFLDLMLRSKTFSHIATCWILCDLDVTPDIRGSETHHGWFFLQTT